MPQQIGFRAIVRRRAKRKCECCGRRISKRINADSQGTIHHRSPRRNGLDNSPANLLLLCLKCHREVHLDEEFAALRGHIVHSDPASTPARLGRCRWALLHPDGSTTDLPEAEARSLIEHIERLRSNRHVEVA